MVRRRSRHAIRAGIAVNAVMETLRWVKCPTKNKQAWDLLDYGKNCNCILWMVYGALQAFFGAFFASDERVECASCVREDRTGARWSRLCRV
jgi:hypothetical protein